MTGGAAPAVLRGQVHAEQAGLPQVGPQLGDVAASPGPFGVIIVAVAGRDGRRAQPDQALITGVRDEHDHHPSWP